MTFRSFLAVIIASLALASCALRIGVSATVTSESLTVTASSIYVATSGTRQISVSGGNSSYTYSIASGGGSISSTGLYTAGSSSGTAVVRAEDTDGVSGTLSLTVYAPLTASVKGVMSTKTVTLAASEGVSPYTYAITSGSGSISGSTFTGAVGGVYDKSVVQVTDAIGNTASFNVYTLGSLTVWLRPDELTSYAHGASIATWPDASENGNDAVQGTPASQPTMDRTSPGLGPLGTVLFGNQSLAMPEFLDSSTSTLIVVGMLFSTGDYFFADHHNSAAAIFGLGSSGVNALAVVGTDNEGDMIFNIGAASTAYTYSVYSMVTDFAAGTPVTAYRDNVAVVTVGSNPAFNTSQTYEGTDMAPSITMASGTVSEFLFYKSTLTNGNRNIVECYLSEKFELALAGC